MSLDDALAHVAGELDSVPRLEPAIEEVAELVTNAADRYSLRSARDPGDLDRILQQDRRRQ